MFTIIIQNKLHQQQKRINMATTKLFLRRQKKKYQPNRKKHMNFPLTPFRRRVKQCRLEPQLSIAFIIN